MNSDDWSSRSITAAEFCALLSKKIDAVWSAAYFHDLTANLKLDAEESDIVICVVRGIGFSPSRLFGIFIINE